MKYKPVILSVGCISLISICAWLLSVSSSPENHSSPNAKREYTSTSPNLKKAVIESKPTLVRQTVTLPNAKRDKT